MCAFSFLLALGSCRQAVTGCELYKARFQVARIPGATRSSGVQCVCLVILIVACKSSYIDFIGRCVVSDQLPRVHQAAVSVQSSGFACKFCFSRVLHRPRCRDVPFPTACALKGPPPGIQAAA